MDGRSYHNIGERTIFFPHPARRLDRLFDSQTPATDVIAVLFKEFLNAGMGMFLFVEMAIFLGVLVVGLIYIYGSLALEWE